MRASPIVYGYSDNLAIFASNPPVFSVSNMVGGGGGGGAAAPKSSERPTGRGTADDPDLPQGRTPVEIPEDPHAETWEATPLTDEQLRNPVNVIPPAARPRVVLRYANANELLVSGLLDGGARTGAARRRDRFALTARATWCCSPTTRSGARRPRAATSWSSTPS